MHFYIFALLSKRIFTQMIMLLRVLMKGLFSWAFSRKRKLLRILGYKNDVFLTTLLFHQNWKALSKRNIFKIILKQRNRMKNVSSEKKTKSNKFKSKSQSFHPVLGIFLSYSKYPVQWKILKNYSSNKFTEQSIKKNEVPSTGIKHVN